PKVNPHVAAIGPTQVRERLSERREASLPYGIVFIAPREHADASHAVALLRACRERPRRRATEPRDELAPLHSITSSASACKTGGTAIPSILAVLRLRTNSNLVGCTTGKLAGFSPLMILPVYIPAWRGSSVALAE